MSPEGINAEVEFFKAQICSSQADPKVPRTVQLIVRAGGRSSGSALDYGTRASGFKCTLVDWLCSLFLSRECP